MRHAIRGMKAVAPATRTRSTIAAAVVAMLPILAGCSNSHGNPDPGGRILAAIAPVRTAVPQDAQLLSDELASPHWDSCDGRAGTFGWSDASLSIDFTSHQSATGVSSAVNEQMKRLGWREVQSSNSPLGPTAEWELPTTVGGPDNAQLAPASNGIDIYWSLDAFAPPATSPVHGC